MSWPLGRVAATLRLKPQNSSHLVPRALQLAQSAPWPVFADTVELCIKAGGASLAVEAAVHRTPPPPAQVAGRFLVRVLRALREAQEDTTLLVDTVTSCHLRKTIVHPSALVVALQHRADIGYESRWLASRIFAEIDSLQASELAQVVLSLQKLQVALDVCPRAVGLCALKGDGGGVLALNLAQAGHRAGAAAALQALRSKANCQTRDVAACVAACVELRAPKLLRSLHEQSTVPETVEVLWGMASMYHFHASNEQVALRAATSGLVTAGQAARLLWAFARLQISGDPVVASLAEHALSSNTSQDVANCLWACSRLTVGSKSSIGCAAHSTRAETAQAAANVAAALGTLGVSSPRALARVLWLTSRTGCPKSFVESALIALGAARRLRAVGRLLLRAAPRNALALSAFATALHQTPALWAELAAFFAAGSDHRALCEIMWAAVGHQRSAFCAGVEAVLPLEGKRQLSLLRYVEQAATPGCAKSVLQHILEFSGHNQWLKICGGSKLQVLQSACQELDSEPRVLEFGTYIGFSSIAMAVSRSDLTVTSLEAHPISAAVALRLIKLSGLDSRIQVVLGPSDVTMAALNVVADMVFLDHSSRRYHLDLESLIKNGQLSGAGLVVADNVLSPGAPLFLNYIFQRHFDCRVYEIPEFMMEMVPDWIVVAKRLPGSSGAAVTTVPHAELRKCALQVHRLCMRSMHDVIELNEWVINAARVRSVCALCFGARLTSSFQRGCKKHGAVTSRHKH
mmetsp:Transcript_122242/g.279961  ORF Transcript_122242/g.279961 Transcript_122242/m.279961 type:complete len:746 (+) Transcript_122242:736-2973(+)